MLFQRLGLEVGLGRKSAGARLFPQAVKNCGKTRNSCVKPGGKSGENRARLDSRCSLKLPLHLGLRAFLPPGEYSP